MKDRKVGSVLKTETKVIAIVVICLVILVLGISYALFFEVKGNEKNQIVKAGTLEFSYANGSQITNATNSECFIPMNNEEALSHSECEYKISIANTGTLPGNYNINLSSESVENPLALSKLKIILKKEGQVVADYPKEGTTTRLIENEKIEAGKVINYSVQVYVDKELVDANDDEKNISIKINGDAVVNSEEVNPDSSILATDYITALSKKDTTNLKADDTHDSNIRYIGASPNNYIDIGDRDGEGQPILWRIIGVMNNITNLDNGGQQESLIKIIRAESIGTYSWDSSIIDENRGFGINEWSQADIMKLLNPQDVYTDTPTVGASLYWLHTSGNCYSEYNETNKTCNFTNSGLSEEAKKKIAKVRWNTGTIGEKYDNSKLSAKYMYDAERSDNNGKTQCEGKGASFCSDTIPRTTTWDGYMGLMYPSDYGYAVGGNVRDNCISNSIFSYKDIECNDNDWLKITNDYIWTMTPLPSIDSSASVFRIIGNNDTDFTRVAAAPILIYPTGYLKSSIKILPNSKPDQEYGSIDNPFVLQ